MRKPTKTRGNRVTSRLSRRLAPPLATFFGLGYAPVAPGTAGSAGALAIAVLLVEYRGWSQAEFGVLAALSLAPGIWAAHAAAAAWGDKDPSKVVVDEVIGQWITIAGATTYNWKSWLAALLLFRFFDIVKPPPARQAERLPGGLGIVADDVVAGLFGALVLFAAGWFNLY
jgi:phosphatidylglycerophosphatase A